MVLKFDVYVYVIDIIIVEIEVGMLLWCKLWIGSVFGIVFLI